MNQILVFFFPGNFDTFYILFVSKTSELKTTLQKYKYQGWGICLAYALKMSYLSLDMLINAMLIKNIYFDNIHLKLSKHVYFDVHFHPMLSII